MEKDDEKRLTALIVFTTLALAYFIIMLINMS